MNKIAFTGYYGYENTGDDLFCLLTDFASRKYWGINSSKFIARNLPEYPGGEKLKGNFLSRKYFKKQHTFEYFYNGITHKNIIYAGGSLFHSKVKPYNKDYIFRELSNIGLLNIGAIGVSVGPFKNGAEKSIKEYLKKFKFISVRDEASYNLLKNMGIKIPVINAFDLAGLLPKVYPLDSVKLKEITGQTTIGVSFCNYQKFIDSGDVSRDIKRLNKYVSILLTLNRRYKNINVKLLVINGNRELGDLKPLLEIKNRIEEKTDEINFKLINYNSNPFQICEEIASCDVVLSTRLHAGIISLMYDVPFVQVEYHKKCTDFLEQISYVNEYKIGDFDVRVEKVIEIINDIIKNKNKIHKADLSNIISRAELNFTATKQYLQ